MVEDPNKDSKHSFQPLFSRHGSFSLEECYVMAGKGEGSLSWEVVGASRLRLRFISSIDGKTYDVMMSRTRKFVEVTTFRGLEAHKRRHKSYWKDKTIPEEVAESLNL